MKLENKAVALIVAAGTGSRAGMAIPKQYSIVRGKPVVVHAAEALMAHGDVGTLFIAIGPGQQEQAAEAFRDCAFAPQFVEGGTTRQESVRNGLEAIIAAGFGGGVLIHDAARPFVPVPVIDRLLIALSDRAGAIPVLPVVDSIVRGDGDLEEAVDRAGLWRVQTPQAFDLAAITTAHRLWPVDQEATDDSRVLAAAGKTVALVAGDERLAKLTYPGDFAAMNEVVNQAIPPMRIGQGYDVHRLEAGEELWLAGVRIAHHSGLAGHSDADVALHAITDALLGAVADGDIGSHFPPSDPQWRGARSAQFLRHAVECVGKAGYRVGNIDLTIICEQPKIGPHRDAMREEIARICSIPVTSVSVKATTTERLGYTGRMEGIAAQAVALVIESA